MANTAKRSKKGFETGASVRLRDGRIGKVIESDGRYTTVDIDGKRETHGTRSTVAAAGSKGNDGKDG